MAAGVKEEDPMNTTSNRAIVAEGLGRLPQFSHATVAGDLIFVSGTLGTLGEAFELAPGGTGPQTTQTLRNIETILRAAGAELIDVVKVSVYLADMSTFQEMNEAYTSFFPDSPPARITVGGAVLALGAAVEIECIARRVP
jgi:2-iminobutanoate/2-iminopropanoate deaminase